MKEKKLWIPAIQFAIAGLFITLGVIWSINGSDVGAAGLWVSGTVLVSTGLIRVDLRRHWDRQD